MLDILERLGFDFDSLDQGHSLRFHGKIFPNHKPQSICSQIIEAEMWTLAWLIGFNHCVRSWERYR